MPPSPALRTSPGKETERDTVRKRGHSLDHTISRKVRDDDLVLFTDMQNKERENFLLQSSDDFDESLSKLRYFSDFKINIPARGESSDLLNAEGDKNDYDWLLTPPDTPLFPSLDDEDPPPVSLITRGRSKAHPVSVSRCSTIERSHRSSRSSASPSRASPSPRSSISTVHSKPRPSSASASRASPPPPVIICTPTPKRPSTPPTKPSTPTRRSASPTPRRVSTGSVGQTRGISPVKTNRGTSSSPKPQRGFQVQPGMPGFSSDAPPNLRTDRPASRSRGLSPGFGSGSRSDSGSKVRRQSMSPTPSRSASSSHSHERDRWDDDVDSMNSINARRNTTMIKNRTVALSKKPSKNNISVASSAPKRSFDSALWLMDHRKAPQNMFRPLLSSVPSTTFVVSKAGNNNTNRPMFSRNSSLTTSSNASSDHGATINPDDPDEEIFNFDKVDEEVADETETKLLEGSTTTSGVGDLICVRCGKRFFVSERNGDEYELCEECTASEMKSEMIHSEILPEFSLMDVSGQMDEPDNRSVQDLLEDSQSEVIVNGIENNDNLDREEFKTTCVKEQEKSISLEQEILSLKPENHDEAVPGLSLKSETDKIIQEMSMRTTENDRAHQSEITGTTPGLRVENSEGTGISILLTQKSNSNKWPVLESRSFSATNIHVSEPYYTRDHSNILKRSIGRESSSASSSVDLGPFKQTTEARLYRLLSNRRLETDKASSVKSSYHMSSLSVGSVSDMSISSSSVRIGPKSDTNEELFNSFDVEDNKFNPKIRDEISVNTMEQPSLCEDGNNNMLMSENNKSFGDNMENESEMVQVSSKMDGLDESRASPVSEKEVPVSVMDSSIVEIPPDSHEEEQPSTAAAEIPKREMQRSFTLEEATDTILFCSSIIHDLAYKAANIALDKDKDSELTEAAPHPTVTILGKSNPKQEELPKLPNNHKRVINPRKVKRKRLDTENITPTNEMVDNVKDGESVMNSTTTTTTTTQVPKMSESMKPPKLESKCNCTIM